MKMLFFFFLFVLRQLHVFHWIFKVAVVMQSACSRWQTHTHIHVVKQHTQSMYCIGICRHREGVTEGCCFPLRCRCRSGLLHLWFPHSEHSPRGARRYLCCHHGLSTSWPPCRSVPPPKYHHHHYHNGPFILEVSFHLFPPALSSEKYQTLTRILWCLLWCVVLTVRRRDSIKSLRWRLLSPHILCFCSISSLKRFLLSLQGRRSTCSCGCVISNWGPLLWTSIRLLG